MLGRYIDFILKNQERDGGFPYKPFAGSVLESTAFSLLALNAFDNQMKVVALGIQYLLSMQSRTGGWFLFKNDSRCSAYGTALGLLTLKSVNQVRYQDQIEQGIGFLERNRGYVRDEDLDEDVWGWSDLAFIGSEPTAIVALALKHLNSLSEYRAGQVEKFFAHTKCSKGGWTFGVPIDKIASKKGLQGYAVFEPQLHVTALVLLAMQDKKQNYADQIKIIDEQYPQSYCPFSLSLSALALDCYKKDNHGLLQRLNEIMAEDGQVNSLVFYHSLAALANLTKTGKNPLCLSH